MNAVNILGFLASIYFGIEFVHSLLVRRFLLEEFGFLAFFMPIKWWALFVSIAGIVIGVMA